MKKLIILMALFLLFSSLFPASFLAADTVKDTTQVGTVKSDEYNEFGIKKGTMVHGEDISKLSEEELQYIPEGWRDGVIEDVHGHAEGEHEEAPAGAVSRASVYPNVNDYIATKKFTTAKTEYDYKSVFPKMSYRYGKVEGVVAHETANDSSTITGEISYMTRNYQNAFVHAFVDHQRIIEIHPTNYSVWGAGRYGNQRFAQVELVRVHTFDNFARSIDNYAAYVASILYKNKLGVSSAEATGSGTLWSHAAISKFLGGTNHSDPHGYFAKYGYNWTQFTQLVTAKYKNLSGTSTPVTSVSAPKEIATSKMGHLKSATAKVYPKLTSTASTVAGDAKMGTAFYIKKEATMDGIKYYSISTQPTTGVVGWVKATDINVQTHSTVDQTAKTFYIKGTGSAFKKPWGGTADYFFKSLVASANAEFKVNLTEKVGSTIWYRGVANERTVWIEEKNVYAINTAATSKLGHIKASSVLLYQDLSKLATSTKAGTSKINSVYYIKKQAVVNGVTYYLLSTLPSSTTGLIGWAKATDITAQTHVSIDKLAKTFYIKGTGSAYSRAWGGTGNIVFSNLSGDKDKVFKVNLTEKVGSTIWYRGILNGKTVMIDSKEVATAPSTLIKQTSTSKLGHIKNSTALIYSDLNNLSKTFAAGTTYTNSVYYIKKEAIVNGATYYLLSNNPSSTIGVVGWVKAVDATVQTHVGVDKKAKTFYVKGTGSAYTRAWGGSKNYFFQSLVVSTDREFKVYMTEKVGSTIWYRGILNGQSVWIEAKHVSAIQKVPVSKLGHIKSTSVKIYPNIDALSTSKVAGTTYTNAVYFIKKEAVVNGQKYYLLSTATVGTTGVVGWVKSTDTTAHAHTTVDKTAKTFYITGTGSSYTKAWGGSKNLVFTSLSAYKNKEFKVNATEKVGTSLWYRGVLDGKTMWIRYSSLKSK
ncbi:peptidoglycan recognition protein family protein [Planococcus shixiaomingii]|uniref:peptidoglycan recognition protein family protein n=1 Tax=Planococcus shixiaomingii TaxID=3058393 RepID=UPI002626C0A3|nr:GW dipeptide domain-containing protein [Planococcus sp. N022]WKA54023.1 GW dipeptide domain-containing protein [Planococcus sp. N022]